MYASGGKVLPVYAGGHGLEDGCSERIKAFTGFMVTSFEVMDWLRGSFDVYSRKEVLRHLMLTASLLHFDGAMITGLYKRHFTSSVSYFLNIADVITMIPMRNLFVLNK